MINLSWALEDSPCFSALPPSAAITVSIRRAITTTRVHCFCPFILKERRDVREEPCAHGFVLELVTFLEFDTLSCLLGGKENTAVVSISLLRQRNSLGNSHSSSGVISTELDSNINILIVCAASTLSVTAAFAVNLRESLSVVDTATVQVGLDGTQ